MELNEQFKLAERYVNNTNVSIFLTGKAGTGKTTFLKHIYTNTTKRCVIVAPTGVAAVNAGGVTIHSFFQLPFCPYLPDVKELVTEYQMPQNQRQMRKEKLRIIRTLDLLIIDEISMVRADLLDAIDDALRRYRRNSRPFGGVQLLLIGDVQQLPPVVTDREKIYMDRVYPSPFFFHSKALQRLQYVTIELTKIYRQQDEHFVRLLNNIRDNRFDADTLRLLNTRYDPSAATDRNTQAIRLTTHNAQAAQINQQRMDDLATPPLTAKAIVTGNFPETFAPTDAMLTLKEGAQVMFIKNDSSGMHRYINGTLGKVVALSKGDDGNLNITVRKEDGTEILAGREEWENIRYDLDPKDNQIKQRVDGTFSQYPLRLAWAVTIHKAQGLTFDRVIIDAAHAFSYGQVYVALSRCRTLEGLILSSPLTGREAFDCSDVMGFVQSYTPAEQAQQRLPQCEQQYFYDVLLELFDFSAIERHADRVHRLFQERLKGLYPEQAQKMFTLRTQNITELLSVNERFRRQLTTLPPDKVDERVGKAAEWFTAQIKTIVAAMQPLMRVDIANQEVEKDLHDNADALADVLALKTICLNKVKEKGFTVETYQKAKLDFVLSQDAPAKKASSKAAPAAEEDTYTNLRHPKLVPLLSRWRKKESDSIGKPANVVLSQKALLGIADKLPQTPDALLAIPGIGPKKVAAYGTAILNIVHRYCDDNAIPIEQHSANFAPQAPKRPSWEVSLDMFAQGIDPKAIAKQRNMEESTIHGHLLSAIYGGHLDAEDYLLHFLSADEMERLVSFLLDHAEATNTEVYEHFEHAFDYNQIRAARFFAIQ